MAELLKEIWPPSAGTKARTALPFCCLVRPSPLAPPSPRPGPTDGASFPWQNGHAERLIGSIRRECLDHIVIFGEDHLRQVLKVHAAYYSHVRPHLALARDAPLS
jgi:hypothetical protein